MKRIGLLGGSFNPIHNGHLLMAQAAMEGLKLDEVIFIPAFCSPHKTDRDLVSAKHRLAMVKAAINGNAAFCCSNEEIRRGGKSYTVDTLRSFKAADPRSKFFFIIGQDSVPFLAAWKDIASVGKLAEFVVANRPGFNLGKSRAPVKLRKVLMPGVAISSSDIRRRIKQNKSIRYLLPELVITYIQRHRLYVS